VYFLRWGHPGVRDGPVRLMFRFEDVLVCGCTAFTDGLSLWAFLLSVFFSGFFRFRERSDCVCKRSIPKKPSFLTSGAALFLLRFEVFTVGPSL
jgi:hypothetical protein